MAKKDRHNAILNLIKESEIDTQEDLTARLVGLGYNVSQATVSRDIAELKLIKGAGIEKKFKYVSVKKDFNSVSSKILNLYKSVVLSVCSANNLIVIKTLSGNASTAGMAIDEMRFSQILGTVAGDDTLLVVAKSNADAELIVKSLRAL